METEQTEQRIVRRYRGQLEECKPSALSIPIINFLAGIIKFLAGIIKRAALATHYLSARLHKLP
jgi:hypothetical protein